MLSAAVALLGLPAGFLLARLAREEVVMARPYLRVLRIVFAAGALWAGMPPGFLALRILAAVLALALLEWRLFPYSYLAWGFLLGIGDSAALSSLVFLFGLVEVSVRRADGASLGWKDALFLPGFALGLLL